MKQYVAYYRVSTDRQGVSGLGLEAQKESIAQFLKNQDAVIIEEYVEIESGKKNNRPYLQEALKRCKKEKATLIIAKLDRLARNVAFISNLMESKVDFLAVDNPHANKLMIHLLAAFAEHEREMISKRTKDALAAAKRRGVVLGKNGAKAGRKNSEAAQSFAETMRDIVSALKTQGIQTQTAIVQELNRMNIPSTCGGKWHQTSVRRLLGRFSGEYGNSSGNLY